MRICTLLLLQLMVVCTYARSFSAVDIPDPPQFIKDTKSKSNIVKETSSETTKTPLNSTTQHSTTTKAPTQLPANTSAPTQPPTTTMSGLTPTQQPTTITTPTQPPTTPATQTQPPTTTATPTQPPTTTPTTPTQPPTTTQATTTPTQPPTTTQATTTTTLDPWDEFCQEACEEGLAGPECDCPEHPIGRRSVGKSRHRRSTFTGTSENDISESLKRYSSSKAKPTVNLKLKRFIMKYCKVVCKYVLDNDICKCSGFETKPGYIAIEDPSFTINGSAVDTGADNSTQPPKPTTTKDPLDLFCETACAEGQGTLACNCHDHIVGRRRRSVKNVIGYPAKGSSTQFKNSKYLETILPRDKLQRHSVQPQDLSVQFHLRIPSKVNKDHADKLTRIHLNKDSLHTQDLGINFP